MREELSDAGLSLGKEGALFAKVGARRGRTRRVLDLLQSYGPCIELALVGRRPLKCVVPEAFEYILRAGNVSGETREVIDGVRGLGAIAVKLQRGGGSGGARDDQRQGKNESIHFSEPEPHAELQPSLAAAGNDPAEIRVGQVAHRLAELRCVERVLGLDSEFEGRPSDLLKPAQEQIHSPDLRSTHVRICARSRAECEDRKSTRLNSSH